MKKHLKICMSFLLGIICSGITVYAATQYLANDVKFTPSNSEWNVDNVSDALNELYVNNSGEACSDDLIGTVWYYNYIGDKQVFTSPCGGIYKVEAWGAQGGTTSSAQGGYGGYSTGLLSMTSNKTLYIYVGGAGSGATGGYNGGGNGGSGNSQSGGGGGGATHIALTSGLLSSLENNVDSVLMVAAGGGGSGKSSGSLGTGGAGGGYVGNTGLDSVNPNDHLYSSTGGTQTEGGHFVRYPEYGIGSFGKGSDFYNTNYGGSGGGGGFYGAGGSSRGHGGAGGGSSYIANTRLISNDTLQKHMTCYNCATSNDESIRTITTTKVSSTPTADYAKSGNGYVKITLISAN